MPDSVNPEELLHRAIKPKPQFWDTKSGRITSALFKDSKGVSVDVNANRHGDEIKRIFLASFSELKGEARLYVKICNECHCKVKLDPSEKNKYHALILGKDSIELTKGQARSLAVTCEVIEY